MYSDAAITFPIFGDNFIINIPRYVQIHGFSLYLYGFLITAGFILAGLYCYKRRNVLGLTQDNIFDIIIISVPCGLIGARIYYILFNAADYFGPGKWHNMFMLRQGGLAVYGGIIASGIVFLVYSRIKKVPVGKLLDAAGFGLFIGQAVGRWGNFVNREAFGVGTDVPWKMGFINEAQHRTDYYHPAFLYESLWNVVGLLIMHIFSKKSKTKYPGQYFLFYVAWYGFGRFMIEGLRTDSLIISGTDIRVSQLLAALSFSVAVILLVRNFLRGYTSDFETKQPSLKPVLAMAGVEDLLAEDLLSEDLDDADDMAGGTASPDIPPNEDADDNNDGDAPDE